MKRFKELKPEELRWRCDPDTLNLNTTEDVEPCQEILGQKRAVEAVRQGLEMEYEGYNIFVTGLSGTGRTTTIKRLLEELRKPKTPPDLLYVHNFKNPDMPILLTLPAGQGKRFKRDMDDLLDKVKKKIPAIFESESYQKKREKLMEKYREKERGLVQDFEERIAKAGFTLMQIRMGPFVKTEILPVIKGKPISFEELETAVQKGKLSHSDLVKLREVHSLLVSEMGAVLKKRRSIEKEMEEAVQALDHEIISPFLSEMIEEMKNYYKDKKLNSYLEEVKKSIIENPQRFQPQEVSKYEFTEYKVNLIVDNSETEGAPVVMETAPTYRNLFGTIEKRLVGQGVWKSDFTGIKAGSLLRANGGYLVINGFDALVEPGVWATLKRTLRENIVKIQTYEPFYFLTTSTLEPEPIKINLKVVMIGNSLLYYLLYYHDADFRKIFKIKADFDTEMPKESSTINQYASFIRRICEEEKLRPFHKTAVAKIIEYGARLAQRKDKLSTRFSIIADTIREAHYWASKDKSKVVKDKHVDRAIKERINRLNLPEEKIQELIKKNVIMIDTKGKVVGQVNGLSVYQLGDYSFGRPSRITAKVSVGRSGVINIEREAELGGKVYNKGVLILAGYLRSQYAQDKPLVMSGSLCFEQSYTGVDGDSASSAEVYALLSSLSGLPLRQDIAVTGSVNQKGEVQPVGGVNEKIEGFFDVCKAKGLTGTQGVIIPQGNVDDLMLKEEVIEAVKKGRFHIYPVKTVDEGIEILTGVRAGKRKKDGTFEKGTVHYLVDKRLREYAEEWKRFGIGGDEGS